MINRYKQVRLEFDEIFAWEACASIIGTDLKLLTGCCEFIGPGEIAVPASS